MKLTFCGAAKIVTGSCYLIEVGDEKAIVDCGMFQGSKEVTRINYDGFNFEPGEISYLFLTHAHIDHSGLIPKLVKEGFRGQIFATPATIDLCKIMLEDAANMQVSETERENRQRMREGLPERKPLYSTYDAKDSVKFFKKVNYDVLTEVSESFSIRYRDAGHIIGSAIIELFVKEGGEEKKIVFSGDLGQWNNSIVKDPTLIEEADFVLVESTYGDRLHDDFSKRGDLLLEYAKEAYKKGGKLMIPSFAVERTQELLYAIGKMVRMGQFPREPVYLDSPLAQKATDVFMRHSDDFDEEAMDTKEPFNFKGLQYLKTPDESAELNDFNGPCVVIAGSGMCTGGRIRHHFKHGLWNRKNTVLFVGYQAEGTLGRRILDGEKEVKMMGITVAVKADIKKITGFSAHADYNGLIKWMRGFKKKPKVFIIHGEAMVEEAFKLKLEAEGFKCQIPTLWESVEL